MDRSDVIILVSEQSSRDARGVLKTTEVEKEVFCNVSSISSAEFHRAGQNGLRPAFKFSMFAYDYANEKIVIYQKERFSIYRTYLGKDDSIELYVQKEVGS